MKIDSRRRLIATYSIVFAVACIIVFSTFLYYGKSFVWQVDGIDQHLNAGIYWGQYIRDFFTNLFHGTPKLPMWDMAIGYGGDVLGTLNYYAIGDPINLIYAFSNKYNAEYFYSFAMLLRLYLAGASFIVYGRYMKKNSKGLIVGALVYVFCGHTMLMGMRHPFFINPMIYLPLLFLGIEKILKKEKPYLFIVTVAVAAASNFYFFYMLVIFSVVYAIFRYIHYYSKESWKVLIKTVLSFMGYGILAMGIVAVIFLPVIISFLGNGRSTVDANLHLLYPRSYYLKVLQEIVGYRGISKGTSLSYIQIVIPAMIGLFAFREKKLRSYKVATVLGFICFCVPICGYVLHGFTYASNRWIFAMSFVFALIVAEMYPRLFSLSKKQMYAIGIGSVIYSVVVCSIVLIRDVGNKYAIGIVVPGTLFAAIFILSSQKRWKINKKLIAWAMAGTICLSLAFRAYYFRPTKQGGVDKFLDVGKAYETLVDYNVNLLSTVKEKDDSLYRVERGGTGKYNYALNEGLNSNSNYYSITDYNIGNTIRGFENPNFKYMFKFTNLRGRHGLESLYGVKYRTGKTAEDGTDIAKIRGFRKIDQESNIGLYVNDNVFPFGYTYDSYITEKEYEELSAVEKEQALLKYAVIDEDSTLSHASVDLPVETKVIQPTKKTIVVKEDQPETYQVDVPIEPGKSNYIRLVGCGYDRTVDSKTTSPGAPNYTPIKVLYNDEESTLNIQDKESTYYFEDRNFTWKLGGSKTKTTKTLTLTFTRKGTYTIDKVYVNVLDDDVSYANAKTRKNEPSLQNIQYDCGNHFSGNVSLKKTHMLCVPIPYSKGWSATDNGKEVKLQRINGMFMGIELKAGDHNIKLDYVTPGIKVGALVSVASLTVFVGLIIWRRRKGRTNG